MLLHYGITNPRCWRLDFEILKFQFVIIKCNTILLLRTRLLHGDVILRIALLYNVTQSCLTIRNAFFRCEIRISNKHKVWPIRIVRYQSPLVSQVLFHMHLLQSLRKSGCENDTSDAMLQGFYEARNDLSRNGQFHNQTTPNIDETRQYFAPGHFVHNR